ncbi:hypothetical protein Mapa_007826 [Marchantia paleacea]|nr:hypothetical protein Mapa_007826 [Marchantia paleacea]
MTTSTHSSAPPPPLPNTTPFLSSLSSTPPLPSPPSYTLVYDHAIVASYHPLDRHARAAPLASGNQIPCLALSSPLLSFPPSAATPTKKQQELARCTRKKESSSANFKASNKTPHTPRTHLTRFVPSFV